MTEAGYEGNDHTRLVNGNRLLRRPDVQSAIRGIAQDIALVTPLEPTESPQATNLLAATASPWSCGRLNTWDGRASLLADIAMDEEQATKDRLLASKLLGHMFGDFISRKKIELPNGPVAQTTNITISAENAKAIAQGKTTLEEVIDAQAVEVEDPGGTDRRGHHRGGGPDAVDLFLAAEGTQDDGGDGDGP